MKAKSRGGCLIVFFLREKAVLLEKFKFVFLSQKEKTVKC